MIYFVAVEHKGIHLACQCDLTGWRCAKCKWGNLGLNPLVGDKCKVCDSKVSVVRSTTDYTQRLWASGVA